MISDFVAPDFDKPLVDWMLAYARAGMAIFPVGANKKPLTRHGVKDATIDEAQIRFWWSAWPFADPAWAIPVEIVVVDLDCKRGDDGLRDFAVREGAHPDVVATPQASTPTGGRHLVYAANGAAYNNGVRLNGSAIDLRARGGYAVLPGPGNGRAWTVSLATPLAPAPDWIPQADDRDHGPQSEAKPFSGKISRYAQVALEDELAAAAAAPLGARNHALNRAAFALGQLVASGALPREEVETLLYEAAADNRLVKDDGKRSVLATIRSGLESGLRKPRAQSNGDDWAAWLATAASNQQPWRRGTRA